LKRWGAKWKNPPEPSCDQEMTEDPSRVKNTKEPRQTSWFLYLIECLDGSLYTGITKDVTARYAAHVSGRGARYTRSHPPARLIAKVEYPDRSSALKAEYRIKQLKPVAKRRFFAELSSRTVETAASGAPENTTKP
jgi:putative endonuclease